MQVCFISKYPPIEGFVSSYTYWLTTALAGSGHTIHLVTNAQEVGPHYREAVEAEDSSYLSKGVVLHPTHADARLGCIPSFNPFTEKLASLALDIVDEADISLIDAWYLIPYGVAGLMTSLLSGLPLVGRVAGTDVERMCTSPQFQRLASSFFDHCSQIIGNAKAISRMSAKYGEKTLPHGIVLDPAFNVHAVPMDLTHSSKYTEGVPVITYVGKAESFKGFSPLVDALSRIDAPFLFLVISNGAEYTQFTTRVRTKNLGEKTLFLPFQPPWKMPSLYRASTAVVCLEHGHLIQRAPIIPREAASCGCCTVMSPEIHSKGYYRLMEKGVHTFVADPEDPDDLRRAVHDLISCPEKARAAGMKAREFFSRLDNPQNHRRYIDGVTEMYKRITEL